MPPPRSVLGMLCAALLSRGPQRIRMEVFISRVYLGIYDYVESKGFKVHRLTGEVEFAMTRVVSENSR